MLETKEYGKIAEATKSLLLNKGALVIQMLSGVEEFPEKAIVEVEGIEHVVSSASVDPVLLVVARRSFKAGIDEKIEIPTMEEALKEIEESTEWEKPTARKA